MYSRNGLYLSLCYSHLKMQLNDIIIVSVMVLDAYIITDTDTDLMAETDISI